jgi:hypothetical protein
MIPHGLVPANSFIDIAPEKHELPVGRAERLQPLPGSETRIFGPVLQANEHIMRQGAEQQHVHQRDDRLLAPCARDLTRPRREKTRVSILGITQASAKAIRLMDGVGIGKQQVIAASRRCQLMASPSLACPTQS